MKSPKWMLAAAAAACCFSLAAQADCVLPPAPSKIPDGNTATYFLTTFGRASRTTVVRTIAINRSDHGLRSCVGVYQGAALDINASVADFQSKTATLANLMAGTLRDAGTPLTIGGLNRSAAGDPLLPPLNVAKPRVG